MEIALGIISLVTGVISLYFLVYKPMSANALNVKENAMNTQANTQALDNFRRDVKDELAQIRTKQEKDYNEINKKKHEAHEKIWKHNEEQDKKIEDHSLRIKVIEREVGIDDGKRN